MSNLPLEYYFDENHPRPEEFHPEGRVTSSCWRGYIGYWKIENDSLYLEKLLSCYSNGQDEIPLSLIFKEDKPPIIASWYTGDLKLPDGKQLLPYVYERDITITVENGRVISERTVDNKDKFATRSAIDLLRTGRFLYSPKDDWKWIDARLIRTVELGKQFVTRGGFYSIPGRKTPVLLIPCTPTTLREEIPIEHLPVDISEIGNAFVEIGAHFEESNGDYLLYVDWIRILESWETIHNPNFKAPPNVKPVWPCIEDDQVEMID